MNSQHDQHRFETGRELSRFREEDRSIVLEHVRWCERKNLAVTTIRGRVTHLSIVAERWHGTPILAINVHQIEAVLDERRGQDGGPITPGSRKAFLSNLRAFYKWAVIFEHCRSNPVDRAASPRLPRAVARPVKQSDLVFAIASAPTPLMRLWLVLGGVVGLRVREIAGIRWQDLDLYDAQVTVEGKGGDERIVPLDPTVVEMFHDLQRFRVPDSDFVFVDPVFGERYTAGAVSRWIGRYFEQLGMDYTAHQLRHRFGTETYLQTEDIRTVQELMGHRSLDSTAIYTKIPTQKKRDAISAMRRVV